MKSRAQKVITTALSGISQNPRDDSGYRSRKNKYSNDERFRNSSSRRTGYANVEREEQDRNKYSSWNDDDRFNEPESHDRFNEYAGHRNQLKPHQLRYGSDDGYFYEYMQPNPEMRDDRSYENNYRRNDYEQEDNNRGMINNQRSNEQQYQPNYRPDFQTGFKKENRFSRFRQYGSNPYGEHPESGGYEEYRGSNKRHPGLHGNNEHDNRQFTTSYRDRNLNDSDERRDERHNERDDYRDRRHDARFDDNDYLNRGQYEKSFHGREHYDPIQHEYGREAWENDQYMSHPYRYEGYQASGNTEGFGIRGRQRHGQDWRDEGEYREGHSQRKTGHGKYGSR